MKNLLIAHLMLAGLLAASDGAGQYCTPTLTTTGIYNAFAGFAAPYGDIPGGTNYNSSATFASEGYVNRSGTSSGTVYRNCINKYYYNLQNCGNRGAKIFNFRIYADWNQDNDFDDANELAGEVSNTLVDGNCAFYSSQINIQVPVSANTGNIRLRWALREGSGIATPCGGYVGEIEDYMITIAPNTAPVLNNTAIPVINSLTETQTGNDGISIKRLLLTTQPYDTIIAEADPCATIKGIALIGTNGANGNWQFKIPAGIWTNMSALSNSNALLLDESCRIRFVPTGAGNAGITFRAWDRTIGDNGQYYNITANGGTTAFSSSTGTSGITVYSSAASMNDSTVYMPVISGTETGFNLLASSFNATTSVFKHYKEITSDSLSGYGNDIVLDKVNSKLYWVGGSTGIDLLRSNVDGTNVEVLITGMFSYPSGLAIGGNKIFIADYGVAVYSVNPDGSGLAAITGGIGQAGNIGDLGDIEYDGGKIYYVNRPGYEGPYKIFQANADGTGTQELLSFNGYPTGLDAINGNLYWTEIEDDGSYIRTRAVTGGSVTTLATMVNDPFNDLLVSPSNGKIYFVDAHSNGLNSFINSIPIAGGPIRRELELESSVYSFVFNRNSAILPVRFINVKASPKGSLNMVEWDISEEENVHHYIVERSADGTDFTYAGIITATRKSRYQWPDEQPLTGNTYYRINSVDNNGKKLYSAIVMVNRLSLMKSLKIVPSVINDGQFTMLLQNITSGSSNLSVFSSTGQKVYSRRIANSGASSAHIIYLPANLSKGIYKIVVTGNNELYSATLLTR